MAYLKQCENFNLLANCLVSKLNVKHGDKNLLHGNRSTLGHVMLIVTIIIYSYDTIEEVL